MMMMMMMITRITTMMLHTAKIRSPSRSEVSDAAPPAIIYNNRNKTTFYCTGSLPLIWQEKHTNDTGRRMLPLTQSLKSTFTNAKKIHHTCFLWAGKLPTGCRLVADLLAK